MKNSNKNSKYYNKTNKDYYWMYGKHTVLHALSNPNRKFLQIIASLNGYDFIQENIKTLSKINREIISNRLNLINIVKDKELFTKITKLSSENVIQGIAANIKKLIQPDINEIISIGKKFLMLDKVSDPHNIGAIIRSAEAFSFDAIIVPNDGSPEENATIAKSAAGSIERIPYISIVNLVQLIRKLKSQNYIIIGLDGSSSEDITALLFDLNNKKCELKKVFILGNEENGLRKLVRENCDFIAKININNTLESLNVSNAAAITMYTEQISSKFSVKVI
ncbi:TrmH family RNA methyltransferase [Lyticum sinuosum]|uniref:23S rRNA (Guanosine-2'-O-)-methyltransferase RlmB n=1 Tax=Lyticum sinuosum TaxID=1332059 RepID=A0AAE5AHE8_9RICK|nr:RNA methyltransferase [Lyticum sinuosum]MDZ5761490.1 23S rRNA (guanosine-2'-O-)-methyltransferase RlmB [Lyticum sinuosum]